MQVIFGGGLGFRGLGLGVPTPKPSQTLSRSIPRPPQLSPLPKKHCRERQATTCAHTGDRQALTRPAHQACCVLCAVGDGGLSGCQLGPSRVSVVPAQYVPVLLQSNELYGGSLAATCASCGGELCVTVSGLKCHSVSLIRQHPHQGVCVRSVRCVSQVPGCTTCSPHHAVRTRPQAGLLLSVTLSHSVRHMASQRQWVAWANPFVV